ncbi:hypothetical protein [Streptomyces phaeofaciens]|uniref:hypothetical protein n=1 Tax=Streptomyces phaeofaciens TaxID=68254 RepID=UPI0036A877E0
MNRSVAGSTTARLVRTGLRAAATLAATGVLTLTAQGAAHAAEAGPASGPTAAASATAASASASAGLPTLPHLPGKPTLPTLPGLPTLPDILGPVVDTLDGNHDWGVLPINPGPGQSTPKPGV